MTHTPKQPAIIVGPKEYIDFPDLGLKAVPAKVDTGADSSAIWASNIQEKDGQLQFVLFDRSSPFYTGEVCTTRHYTVSSIKNSFGHTEFRYKTPLKVVIAGRKLQVRFTLANRENNRLPILIGRRTLHGKFLVDVSRVEAPKPRRLLVISSKATDTVEAFLAGVKSVSQSELSVTYATYDDMTFTFGPGVTRIVLARTGEDIASFDVVHFKTWKERDVTAAMAYYLQKRGVQFFDKRAVHFSANSKLYQYVQLNDNGIAVPPSVFVMPSRYEESFKTFSAALGLPFVFKGVQASRGADNFLIQDERSYQRATEAMLKNNVVAIAQKFIPNDGDYRMLVFGRHLAMAIYRSRQDTSTHLNNTSQGGTATLVPLEHIPTEVCNNSITAADMFELGVSGVDMVQDKTDGMWYCFEVNGDPQIASGAFVTEKQHAYAAYIENLVSR